ncbi:RagB/SusD family nutrient uptake outer membrane protein [Solitalea sp. MAHUQ-68]|uniref:RagB/SusD family nutrient uptake outer membrane protein n=1 Tax=Solitalea agri TaxID=2953739 RepID=A0A9X2JDE7_9SPHI|nr:RagB/SusD family nutrient uptake outer membrane protein [Solitalea agri]MCO4293544.1 RagB/SusD family nutrient uptake outer membrane protein [Solitalea agri]
MKKIYILVSALTLSLTACSVKEEILDEANGGNVVSDSKNVEMIAAPAYAYLRDLNSRSGVWGTLLATTDELAWPARGADWVSVDYQSLCTHTYKPTNIYIRNTWNSFLIGVTRCNVALQYLSAFPKSEKTDGYIAEVRFIRALCMFKLADAFGKFPFREYTETDYSKQPTIYNREQAVERIIKEMNEIIPVLKNKADIPYGRVTKAAAQMLLANVYLNHEVYTGKAKWQETIKACDDIINSNQYKVADDYWGLFQYDNASYLQSTESILSVIYDETNGLTGLASPSITLHYNQKFGTYTSLLNGCCTTPAFVDTWDVNDKRFKDTRLVSQLGFNQGLLIGQQYSIAGVALKTRTGAPLIYTKDFSISNSKEEQGVRIVKFAPNPSTTSPGQNAGNDFPLYRLSDTYLIRAEARFRAGDVAGALTDINYIRNTKRGQPAYTELDLDKILNERGYELYWEGNRRTDLIRFNKYTAPRAEKNFETPAYMVLLPIPISAIEANPNLTQNIGYN